MRVLVISRSCHPLHGYGGMERHVGQAIEYLTRHGATVTLLTRPPSTRASSTKAQKEIHVPYSVLPFRHGSIADRNTNYFIWIWRTSRIIKYLERVGAFDAIYGHGMGAISAALASNAAAAATCFNPHGLEEFRAQDPFKRLAYWPARALQRSYARKFGVVLATDYGLVPLILRFLRPAPQRIKVLPNAVDLEAIDVRIAAYGPRRPGPADRLRVVSIGRLEPNKGHALLLAAAARLPKVQLAIVGDGSHRRVLTGLIDKYGLSDRVTLAGNLTDLEVTALLLSSDVYCQPSLYEGSSIAVLEAMAHSLPVVASRTGGLPDKVLPGTTGLLVDPGSVDQLVEAFEALDSDPQRRREMGLRARQMVEDRFSWNRVGRDLVDILRQLRQEGP